MENNNPSEEQKEQWHKDPGNWIWGIFYYNKADKRLLPPKRIKWMGWTVNFANWESILFSLALIAVVLLMAFINILTAN